MIDVTISQRIRHLAQTGMKIRQIAKETGIARNTVRQYLREATHGLKKSGGSRPFSLDKANAQKLRELFNSASGNSVVIQRHLQKDPQSYGLEPNFTISDRSVRRYFKARHPDLGAEAVDPSFTFTTEPGAQLQIDFVEARFQFAGKSRAETVYIFEAVYAWSRKAYVRVCKDMTQVSWLLGIADCLARYGIPRQILCDNDKSLVLSTDPTNGKARFHPAFLWLCKPLGILPIACRPRRAKTKGRIERFGRYLQENGLAECAIDRDKIPDRMHLQKALDRWIEEVADRRWVSVSDGHSRMIGDLYAEEKTLLSFPHQLRTTFDITTWVTKASKLATVNVYGVAVQLSKDLVDKVVYVSLRANGEILITTTGGAVVAQSVVPAENMREFRRDQAASPKLISPSRRLHHEKTLKEYEDILD